MGAKEQGTCARLLDLGLVSLQVQRSQQEAAAAQGDDEDAAQEALLKAEEALQVSVGAPRPQGTGDLQRREAGSAGPTRKPLGLQVQPFPGAPPPTRPYKSREVGAAGISQDVAHCDLKRLSCPPAPGHHHRLQNTEKPGEVPEQGQGVGGPSDPLLSPRCQRPAW